MLYSGYTFAGESGRIYRLISPLGVQKKASAPNFWKAVNDADDSEQFVIKEPSSDDDATLNWPAFQHEVEMQKLLKTLRSLGQWSTSCHPRPQFHPEWCFRVSRKPYGRQGIDDD